MAIVKGLFLRFSLLERDTKKIQDTKTLFLIRKTSHKITIVKPNIFYKIYDT